MTAAADIPLDVSAHRARLPQRPTPRWLTVGPDRTATDEHLARRVGIGVG